MSKHWQFSTDATAELNNRVTSNAAPLWHKWAVFIGVISWFECYDPWESLLVERVCKQLKLQYSYKEMYDGIWLWIGKEGEQLEKPV
jgi:hypothetical protein